MKDHKSLKMSFNISQMQELPINTEGIQTDSLKETVKGVMCELDMEWSARRIITYLPLMLPYYVGLSLQDICYERILVFVLVLLSLCFSLSDIIT